MERSEPAFVPEWLKSSGSVTGGGSTNHQFVSSSSHADDYPVSKHTRNKSSASSDNDIGRTFVSDRTTSSYFRRSSSSNGSALSRSYSSFSRGHRDRDREKDISDYHEKEKSVLGDHRNRDYSDPLGNILPSRFEKDVLLRSQSMITGKRVDSWPKKVVGDSIISNKSNHTNGNGLLVGVGAVSSMHKAAFERDFPSLGAEERQGGSEIGRVSSPGLSTAIQSRSVGNSAVIGGDGWTSALAEVPVVVGSNSMGVPSAQLPVSANSASLAPSMTTGLNMAETVAQGPSRTRTPPQLTVGTQRLEELAIKQSRQLIPMTPSMPKTLVVSPSEKSKPKIGQQQHLSHTVSHTRGGSARSDSPRTSNEGRLHVLKPSRELNGVSSSVKDSLSPKNGSKVVNSSLGVTPAAAGSAPLRSSSNSPNFNSAERNLAPFRITVEKRPTSQAQSRNDFFNLLKKKSSTNSLSAVSETRPSVSSSVSEKSDEFVTEDASAITLQGGDLHLSETSVSNSSIGNVGELTHNGDAYDGSLESYSNGEKHLTPDVILYPDEEEAAFLRSLGWEENTGEDEGLTEEEISAFYKEYMKLRPSSKLLHGVRPTVPHNSHNGSRVGVSSGLSSSESESES